jgi:hypothetical protein
MQYNNRISRVKIKPASKKCLLLSLDAAPFGRLRQQQEKSIIRVRKTDKEDKIKVAQRSPCY